MLDIRECCRLCIKPRQQSMKDCADDPLAVTIRDIFGIEFVVNGPLSTKICRECIFKVLDINLFKNTVQNNQTSLEEYRILQESLQLSESDVKQEDDDDVILVKDDAPNSSTNYNNLEQTEKNIKTPESVKSEKKVKTFAIKRSLSPELVKNPVPEKIKLKKLKILCHPLNAKDVSQFRLKEVDKRILKLNGKKVEPQKESVPFKEIEQNSCEPTTARATKTLMSAASIESEDEDNDDGTIMTLKDYFDMYGKKSSEIANMSSTSGMSTPQNVASVSSLTITPPLLAPGVKDADKSNLKQYAAKNAYSKQNSSTPLLAQMKKCDILNITPRNPNQPQPLNQLKLVVNQPKPANLPKPPNLSKPANQPQPQNVPKFANQPKPRNLSNPINHMNLINQPKPANQPNNKPAPQITQGRIFYTNVNATQNIPSTNTNINIQTIPTSLRINAVRSVESPEKVIVPATITVPRIPIMSNVCSAPPLTIPKNAEQGKASKLFICGGKIFNDQGGCLGAVGDSIKHIQALAQANGNTYTFKVSRTEAQKWQDAILEQRIAPVPGSATAVPIAGTTISAISGVQIPSVPSTAAATASSSSMGPFPVQLISVQPTPRLNLIQQPKSKPIESPRRPVPIITPDSGFGDSVIDNRVKVLSVNELNNRAADGNSDTRKLPIRITLVKIKNEVQIKLTDSKNNEIHYIDLTPQEQTAVKTSLLQPSSKIQIISAIKSCKPDQYSEKMLQAFGISVTDLAKIN